MQRLEIVAPIGFADGFEHFDGDDGVELAGDVAVILQPQLGFIAQPGGREIELGGGNGEAGDLVTTRRRIFREATPAAADLKNMLRGCTDFVKNAGIFRVLRVVQRNIFTGEKRGRIGHAFIKPEPVEGVADIVMFRDVVAAAAAAIAAEETVENDEAQPT